jgi:serine/threonine-protein kinase HipA
VKFWDPAEFPQLAANEFFCLKAAERCGLNVPPHKLAEDGSALVMERFDLRPDGTYRGFEDFCVLNARRTDEKYRGSYETNVMKRFQQFANSPTVLAQSLQLFTLLALNCAIRNGGAHLKNFGIVYDDVMGEAHLAPVYDLVTTSAYIPQDRMALTLNGTNEWPTAKELIRFGEARSLATRKRLTQILELICDALADTVRDVLTYSKEHNDFGPVVDRMLMQWKIGQGSITVRER